jgi:type II secretory pathway component GspD/PulD (secretin)
MKTNNVKTVISSVVVFSLAVSGCRRPETPDATPEFIDFYQRQKTRQNGNDHHESDNRQTLTISTQDMPLTEFLRWLSNATGISVVCAESIDTRPVTVDIVQQGVDGILSVVARRLGVQVTRTATVYYLGALSPEDRGILVRRVSRLSGQQLNESITTLLSEHGRVAGYDDGLVIVGDKVEILQRVSELIEGVENAPADSWFVQVYLLSFHDDELLHYGVDLSLDASLEAGFLGAESVKGGFLTAALTASQDSKLVTLLSSPFFVVADGSMASYVSGQNVPIPRKAVSDAGTVTTTGYDYQQTGLQFRVSLRQIQSGKASIALYFESSTIVDYIEAAPIALTEKFEAALYVQSSLPYLVGSIKTRQNADRVTGLFRQSKTVSGDTLQIWCKAYMID